MFKDRQEAGEKLTLELKKTIKSGDFVVVVLLRGGIILGKKISDYFNIPLHPLAVKKIGAPLNPELAIGAVVFDRTYYFDRNLIKDIDVSLDYKKVVLETKYKEAKLFQKKFDGKMKKVSLQNKNIIVVDDGVATGNTAICAALYLRKQKANKIILAIPVISKDRLNNIKKYFDKVISLKIVENLGAVGEFYESFPQVEDKEVLKLLQ